MQKFKEHEAGHVSLKPHQCSVCDEGFQTSKGLENHMQDHTGEKPFPCVKCGKRFKQEPTLQAHDVTHSRMRPHLCSVCGKSFAKPGEHKVHLRVHTGEKPYQCDEFGKSFYYRRGFNNHKKTHDAKPIGPTRQRGRPRQPGSVGKSNRAEKISQRADSDGDDLTWEPPETSSSNFGHYTAFNQNPGTSNWRAAKGHQAYGAPAGADISALLRDTTESHCSTYLIQDKKKLTFMASDITVKNSSSHEKLQGKPPEEPKQNQKPRRQKKSYDCPTCGRVFSHSSALQRHLVIHSGKRPFKCFICGRGFTQSGNLKTHMKVHRGESAIPAPAEAPTKTFDQSENEKPPSLHSCSVKSAGKTSRTPLNFSATYVLTQERGLSPAPCVRRDFQKRGCS
ncbi:hypothetical protein L3Q82_019954 [Scortum barcoo]|uniref:Uncharacterized protein n=1 Tax=Scortum barcoo TaxID=214431 RepID=A0ACB8VCL9_9TELE|nr:hypothetical protein L3Q82_019954 [Scortum barcoo]